MHHRVTPEIIEACIARNPGKPGAAKLRHALGADVTLSKLEDAFLKLARAHDLPVPRTNIDVRGDKVDCHWERTGSPSSCTATASTRPGMGSRTT